MGITINSLKKLNSNDYQNMIIKKNDYGYSINISKEKRNASMYEMVGKRFKTLNDDPDARLVEVIEFFLENHTVNELKMEGINYHNGYFLSVVSDSSKMSLQIPKKVNDKDLFSIIYSKYEIDRSKFLNSHASTEKYNIFDSASSMCYTYDDEKDCISLSVASDMKETEFLKAFIKDKVNSSDCIFYDYILLHNSVCTSYKYKVYSEHLIFDLELCNNLYDNPFIDDIKETISSHNESVTNNKKMQLKLEGF